MELVNLGSIMIMSKKEQSWLGVGWCPARGLDLVVEEEGNRPKSPAVAFFQRTTIHTGGAELAWAELLLSEISGQNWHLVGIQEKCITNNGFQLHYVQQGLLLLSRSCVEHHVIFQPVAVTIQCHQLWKHLQSKESLPKACEEPSSYRLSLAC